MESPMETIDDFRWFWTDDKEIETWLAKSGLKDDSLKIQAARVRLPRAGGRRWAAAASEPPSLCRGGETQQSTGGTVRFTVTAARPGSAPLPADDVSAHPPPSLLLMTCQPTTLLQNCL